MSLLGAFTHTQVRDVKKISNMFDKEAINCDFSGIALKLEKVGPTFLSSNPCPSLQFFATDDRL